MLDRSFHECPICRGWNCTPASPHTAWILGTPENTLVRGDREERERFQADRDAREKAHRAA